MKYIEKIGMVLLLTSFFTVGFNSCTVDEPIIVTPKTIDEYVAQFGEKVKAELRFVDTCKVSYKKNDFAVLSASSYSSYRANYIAALKADSAVIYSPTVTIAQIVAANATLAVPGKAFRAKINITDLRELNDSIVSATTLVNKTASGTAPGNVLQVDKTIFSNAIGTAISTRDALTTIDRQVKTALELLKEAKTAFIASILPPETEFTTYLSASKASIASQLAFVNSTIAGYNMGEYLPTLRANFLAVLQSSQTTVLTEGVTYTKVATAMNNLVVPKTAFVANLTDKRDLRLAITADSLLNTQVTVGNAEGQISTAVQTNLKNYIASGVSTRDNPLATDGATKLIRYLLTVYKDAVIASKPLNLAIVNAGIYNASVLVGTSTGKISQGAKSTFTDAINAAIVVRDSKVSTADQMTTALATLTKAQLDFSNLIYK